MQGWGLAESAAPALGCVGLPSSTQLCPGRPAQENLLLVYRAVEFSSCSIGQEVASFTQVEALRTHILDVSDAEAKSNHHSSVSEQGNLVPKPAHPLAAVGDLHTSSIGHAFYCGFQLFFS